MKRDTVRGHLHDMTLAQLTDNLTMATRELQLIEPLWERLLDACRTVEGLTSGGTAEHLRWLYAQLGAATVDMQHWRSEVNLLQGRIVMHGTPPNTSSAS